MEQNNIDRQKLIKSIIASSGGKLNQNDINNAINKKDASSLIKNLAPQEKQKLTSILADKSNLASILNSNEVKSILKSFLNGGGNNG